MHKRIFYPECNPDRSPYFWIIVCVVTIILAVLGILASAWFGVTSLTFLLSCALAYHPVCWWNKKRHLDSYCKPGPITRRWK